MKSAKHMTAVILALIVAAAMVATATATPPSATRTVAATEFQPVVVPPRHDIPTDPSPSPTPRLEVIAEPMPEFSIDPRPKVKVPTPEVVVQPKATPKPKNVSEPTGSGNKPPSRAKVKAWTRDKLNNDTQFACLDKLWWKESAWRWNAGHPSRAYGIPQAYPGTKMATMGSDWRTNPITQVKWGLRYIKGRYGTACKAWEHSKAHNWY